MFTVPHPHHVTGTDCAGIPGTVLKAISTALFLIATLLSHVHASNLAYPCK